MVIPVSEEIAFRRMFRYFVRQNLSLFLKGNLLVEDEGRVLRLYREKRTKVGLPYYDLGIVY